MDCLFCPREKDQPLKVAALGFPCEERGLYSRAIQEVHKAFLAKELVMRCDLFNATMEVEM